MTTIDLTRSIFEPRKRYAGVRMQQGRVVLDDDHNEASDLALEDLRRTRIDVIGPSGSPDSGFLVKNPTLAGGLVDFQIGKGVLYAGGLRLELHHDTTFAGQPDWLTIANSDRTRSGAQPADLVYVEAWQQPTTAAEDRELLEPALAGADTTVRLRTMARVRRRAVASANCSAAWAELTAALASANIGSWQPETCELTTNARLRVDYVVGGVPEDLCSPSVTAGYLGAQNQAIRVQLLHRLGAVGSGELVWGYDDGAPLYRARRVDNVTLELETPPRDEAHWPLLGQTIEVLEWSAALVPNGNPSVLDGEVLADAGGRADRQTSDPSVSPGRGHLTTLASSYNPTSRRITLTGSLGTFNVRGAAQIAAGINSDHDADDRSDLVFVRVWHRGSDFSSPARVPYTVGSPVTLGNTGIRVTITGSQLGSDSHWIVAARPSTPDQVYPWKLEDAAGREPNGLRKFLVPLAVISWSGAVGTVHDCRESFRPLTRIRSCCRFTVGDGTTSHGDFLSVQAAIDNLPAAGGEICILPGVYEGRVRIDGRVDVTLHGCGSRSLLTWTKSDEPVILARNSSRITLRDFAVDTDSGWGIRLDGSQKPLREVEIERLEVSCRERGAVLAQRVEGLRIRHGDFIGKALAKPPTGGTDAGRLPLLALSGDAIHVTDNHLTTLAGDSPALRVAGGIQIAGGSADVWIERNTILGGNGTGVVLGHVETELDIEFTFGVIWLVPYWYWDGNCLRMGWTVVGVPGGIDIDKRLVSGGPLENVWIRDNTVQDMAGDGIGVAWFFDDYDGDDAPDDVILVRSLRVIGNRIHGCNLAEREILSDFLADWSAHGPIALAAVEDGLFHDNLIEGNGVGNANPLCGLFVLDGEALVIERNQIRNNGRTNSESSGVRGGIVLLLVSPYEHQNDKGWDGRAAARVADNQVAAPEGRALQVHAVRGEVIVQQNQLTRFGRGVGGSGGGVIYVLNNGLTSENFGATNPLFSDAPNEGGQIVLSDNVVNWAPSSATDGLSTSAVTLFTFDDVFAQDNVSRVDGVNILFDWFVFGATLSLSDNRIRETPRRALFSIFSLAMLANQTLDNLCTHCVLVVDGLNGTSDDGTGNRQLIHHVDKAWCRLGNSQRDVGLSNMVLNRSDVSVSNYRGQ